MRITILVLCGWMFSITSSFGNEKDPYVQLYLDTLRRNDIPPNGGGAVSFLQSLHPDENTRSEIGKLIQQLHDDDYQRRNRATNRLMQLPVLPVHELTRTEIGNKPEAAWRAQLILDRSQAHTTNLVFAALKVISFDSAPGATSAVLGSLPFCRQIYLVDAAHDALRACAGPNDVELLRSELASREPKSRTAAAIALAQVFKGQSLLDLHPLLDDSDDQVALSVALTVADVGDRHSLPALVRLLESSDSRIRAESALVLQGLSGKQMGFTSYDPRDERAVAVHAWKDWLKKEGDTAALTFPVRRQRSARGDLRGHTLVSTGSRGVVIEMDASGKTVWSYQIDAWSAEKLVNGNVLISSYTKKKVLEVNPQSKVVWEFDGASAMTAKPLMNGNILVADFSGRRVIEVDRAKQIAWEHKTPGECFDADRLANGNTIFGCPNLVREVTPEGETVNEWEIKGRLNGFQALDNGNIIVANYGQSKVYELTPDGETVWELAESRPCDVFRLPSGLMLVSTAARIIEVGPDKKVLRVLTKASYGSARR